MAPESSKESPDPTRRDVDVCPCGIMEPDMTIVGAPRQEWFGLLASALRGDSGIHPHAVHAMAHEMYECLLDGNPTRDILTAWGRELAEQCTVLLADYLCQVETMVGICLAQGQGIVPVRLWITDLLTMLATFMKILGGWLSHRHHDSRSPQATCLECSRVTELLRSLCSRIPRILDSIWNLREILFVSEREAVQRSYCPQWFTIYSAVNSFLAAFTKSRILVPVLEASLSAGARVALVVWIYGTTDEDVSLASRLVWAYANHRMHAKDVMEANSVFYKNVAHGCTGPRHIHNAMLRDVKTTQGKDLGSAIFRAMTLRASTTIDVRPRREHALLLCCLAACRFEICSGRDARDDDRRGDSARARMFQYLIAALSEPIQAGRHLVPENIIYAIIAILGQGCVSEINDETLETAYRDKVEDALNNCAILLRVRRRHSDAENKPPSLRTRRFTEKAWQETRDAMVAGGWHRHQHKKAVYSAWMALGRSLNESSVEELFEVEVEVEIVKRCAWEGCMCSVYKPIHSLKVCTGCSAVAYCNSHCQKADRGEHRQVCARGGLHK